MLMPWLSVTELSAWPTSGPLLRLATCAAAQPACSGAGSVIHPPDSVILRQCRIGGLPTASIQSRQAESYPAILVIRRDFSILHRGGALSEEESDEQEKVKE